jgi:hypothetical protein
MSLHTYRTAPPTKYRTTPRELVLVVRRRGDFRLWLIACWSAEMPTEISPQITACLGGTFNVLVLGFERNSVGTGCDVRLVVRKRVNLVLIINHETPHPVTNALWVRSPGVGDREDLPGLAVTDGELQVGIGSGVACCTRAKVEQLKRRSVEPYLLVLKYVNHNVVASPFESYRLLNLSLTINQLVPKVRLLDSASADTPAFERGECCCKNIYTLLLVTNCFSMTKGLGVTLSPSRASIGSRSVKGKVADRSAEKMKDDLWFSLKKPLEQCLIITMVCVNSSFSLAPSVARFRLDSARHLSGDDIVLKARRWIIVTLLYC